MKITNQDFLNYVQELTKSELKGLNFKLQLDPMPLTYSINGDCYINYLHEIKRNGKTLLVNSTVDGPYIDEDGFLENENDVFTFKNDCYTLKGRNFGATIAKEWPGKTIYFNFDSIFGDFFLKFFEEEVSDYLS